MNCLEIENCLTNAKLCGKIFLHTKEWKILYICNFCQKIQPTLPELLRHSLCEHVQDVPQDKLQELCHVEEIHESPMNLEDHIKQESEDAVAIAKDVKKTVPEVSDIKPIQEDSSLTNELIDEKNEQFEFLDIAVNDATQSPVEKTRKFLCKICDAKFEFLYQLTSHLKTHGMKPYVCQQCGTAFTKQKNLKVHNLRHLGIKPHSCTYCQKAFTSSSELKNHTRTHTDERPYKCNDCDKAFRVLSNLISHRHIHTNERPSLCSICGKAFYNVSLLAEHMKTHSTERPHKCAQCDGKFTSLKGLRQHMQLHSDVKKYSCKFCGKLFAQAAGVYSHVKTTHKNEK